MFPETRIHDFGSDESWITIARLTRTRGNRGELTAISLSTSLERFEKLGEVRLFRAKGFPDEPRTYRVECVWQHGERLIFKFEGVDSITDAEPLAGADVCVHQSERMPAPEGDFYVSDLVGCEVVELPNNQLLGTVTDWLEIGTGGTLEVTVKSTGQRMLIPFAKAICVEIDTTAKRIRVNLPEGLKDLPG